VCFEWYDDSRRFPLVLQCGHTYCSACVSTLPKPRLCPVCRSPEQRKFSQITPNYQLADAAVAAYQQLQQQQEEATEAEQDHVDDSNAGIDVSQLHLTDFGSRVLGSSSVARVVEGTYQGRAVSIRVWAAGHRPYSLSRFQQLLLWHRVNAKVHRGTSLGLRLAFAVTIFSEGSPAPNSTLAVSNSCTSRDLDVFCHLGLWCRLLTQQPVALTCQTHFSCQKQNLSARLPLWRAAL
jgi:hypothetical protein